MKKILFYVIGIFTIFPLAARAEEVYNYLDFRVDTVKDEIINNTDIKVFASLTSDSENLIDRTSDFNIFEKNWSICLTEDCLSIENVSEDAVFEDDKEYILMVKFSINSEVNIINKETSIIKYNNVPIEDLDGQFEETDNIFMLKIKTHPEEIIKEKTPPKQEELEKPKVIEAIPGDQCLLGLSVCCTNMAGISVCTWIIFATGFLLLIVIICAIKSKKNLKR